MADNNEATPFLNGRKKNFARSVSHAQDELQGFRSWLRWMCMDQSNLWTVWLSWLVFVLMVIVVPCFSHFVLSCADCDTKHTRPYDGVVQLSLSGIAALSFVCLSGLLRKFGLRRFLFFDKLCHESETVRKGYTQQLNSSRTILFIFVLPCFGVECAYKIWWYVTGASQIPVLGNAYVSDVVSCILELSSWLYRTVVFFLVCVLFRLFCQLQILRLQDFSLVFEDESAVESVLKEHLKIRRHLRIISHRYRTFILWALIFITANLFASLLMTTRSSADLNIYQATELVLASISLLAGIMILLRSATRITHKAQSITSLATKWHVCATIESLDMARDEAQMVPVMSTRVISVASDESSDADDVGDEEDELDNTRFVPSYALSTISFQKRQALVTYFENNKAGITVYGFMLDRVSLHIIFGIELSLVLWLLGKTIANL
ncbi:hypothetical protein U1Q18_000374 [Sarracenia purpurea var. burkii]